MNNSIDAREQAMEGGFQNQNLVHFKIIARRNKLFGAWAAELMGLPKNEIETYVKDLIETACSLPNDLTLLECVRRDLKKEGINISEFKLKKQLEYCYDDADIQIKKGL
jgi:hypothetical protein